MDDMNKTTANIPRAVILLYKDGTVHLCLDNHTAYHLTASMLTSFLTDPGRYIASNISEDYSSTGIVMPEGVSMQNLRGLSLATYGYNRNLNIIFPEMLRHVFSLSSTEQKDNRLNMTEFIYNLDTADAKAFLLRYFLTFSRDIESGKIVHNVFNIDETSFYSIIREIFNASTKFLPPAPPPKTVDQALAEAVGNSFVSSEPKDHMVTLAEYCNQNGILYEKARRAVLKGLFKTAKKDNRKHLIDKREPVPEKLLKKGIKRTKKSAVNPEASKGQSDMPTMSAEQVHEYIVGNNLFTFSVAKYIHSMAELDYYLENNYKEVEWDSFRFLIFDVDLTAKDEIGRTNRERILSQKSLSPVIYHAETGLYHAVDLHHLGMRGTVLCALDGHIHESSYSVFHNDVPTPGIHDQVFDDTRVKFWKRYVEEIDKNGSFDKIRGIITHAR